MNNTSALAGSIDGQKHNPQLTAAFLYSCCASCPTRGSAPIAHRRLITHTVAVLSTMLLSCKRLWFARRSPALLAWARARRPDMRPTVSALHEIQVYVKAYVLQAQKNKNTGNLRHSIASKHQRVPIPFTDPKEHSDRAPLHLQRPSVPPYSRRDSPQPPGEL